MPPYEHKVLSEHDSTVYAVAHAPDGKTFATADTEGKRTLLWDAATHELRQVFKEDGHGRVYGVDISSDGKLVATADYDNNCAYTWSHETGKLLQIFKGHIGGVWDVAFSPDSSKLMTGAWDCTAKVWDAATGKCRLTL